MLLLSVTEHITEHPDEIGIYGALLAFAGWASREWWKSRVESKRRRRVESKIETDKESSLSGIGSKNPGRTTVELVEVLYEDFKEYRKETRDMLNKHTQQIGEIRGRIGIKED